LFVLDVVVKLTPNSSSLPQPYAAAVFHQSHQFMATPAELDNISPDDPRLSPGYYAYYYSQRRLDPRLPPPLVLPWSGYGHYDDDDDDAASGNGQGVDGGFSMEPTDEELSKARPPCHYSFFPDVRLN
jgi:hypothetical protein